MANPSIYAVFERMWQHILTRFNNYVSNETFDTHASNVEEALDEKADLEHAHDAEHITSGVLGVEYGGTGYDSIVDTEYSIPRYRASALVPVETVPDNNGTINWVYE